MFRVLAAEEDRAGANVGAGTKPRASDAARAWLVQHRAHQI